MAQKYKRFNPEIADQTRALWGDFLRTRREELKLTQKELADMIGCHRNRIQEMERGNTNYTINQFIAALGCLHTRILLETRDINNDVTGYGPVSGN